MAKETGKEDPASLSSIGNTNIKKTLDLLTKKVAGNIPDKVKAIRETWARCQTTMNDGACIELLHRQTHTLSGTMNTYGFIEIANAAKNIELALMAYQRECPATFPSNEIESLLTELEQTAALASNRGCSNITPMLNSTVEQSSKSRTIFLVDDDQYFLNSMELHIRAFGYDVISFNSLQEFDEGLSYQEPAVVVMDVVFGEQKNGGIEHIAALNSKRDTPLSTVFITAGSDLHTRLSAVRAQGLAYFTKPVLVEQLIDCLDRLTHQTKEEPYRIVIVDDSKEQSEYAALILQQAGMQTREVNGPLDLLQELAEYPADLILMDLYMPDCSGLELSKVIRQIEAYVSIPIVFLSAELDLERKLGAMSLGGDDFLTKPVQAWHLVSAVTSRVIRGREIRKLADTDGLTGLLNHNKIKERLSIELAQADREGSQLSYAMLDIDHFKQVNDSYGHPTGDRVIKSLSHLLKQRVRNYDIIGRYGGEEFVVIFPNTNLMTAKSIMDKLRESFSQIHHYSDEGGFYCQFSCGIACFPEFKHSSRLSDEADKALYQAKRNGRNQVICKHNDH